MSGDLRAALSEGGTSLSLTDSSGTPELRYVGLTARDSRGQELRAWMELRGAELLLKVDDTRARYPITIDPWVQQAKLSSSGGASGDLFGCSVAISGNTIVVGAYGVQSSQGAAYVFVKPASGWQDMTQTAELTASNGAAGALFGWVVAISGNTVVVGAPWQSVGGNARQGEGYVFVKPKGGWKNMTETARLTASDGQQYDQLSDAVAIVGDTVVAGEPAETQGCTNNEPGAAYVFVKASGGWKSMTQTAKLTASGAVNGDQVGYAVAMTSNTVVVGAVEYCSNGNGAAYVYVEPSGGWSNMTQTAKLTASDGAPQDLLGYSVSISGNTIVAGAPSASLHSHVGQGKAYVFVEPSGGWSDMTQTAKLSASDGGAGDYFGSGVANTSSTIAIGAPHAGCPLCFVATGDQNGEVYVFYKPSSGWKSTSKFNAKLQASDGAAGDGLGYGVSINGNTIVSGAPFATVGGNSQQGAAYVFGK